MIVRKEEAPPFASHRSLARFASSTVKIIIFFFREAADEEEEEERPRPLSSPGAEVGAETVLPACWFSQPFCAHESRRYLRRLRRQKP